MATTSKGKSFGVVTTQTQADAITNSISDANAGNIYITKTTKDNNGGTGDIQGNASDAMALTMNGNVLRGISKTDAINLSKLGDALTKIDNMGTVYSYKGSVNAAGLKALTSVKQGDVYNCTESITIDNKTYSANTNFAALKDGKGSDSSIWDSLGGITGTASLSASDSASKSIVNTWTEDTLADTMKKVMLVYSSSTDLTTMQFTTKLNNGIYSQAIYLGTGLYIPRNNPYININYSSALEPLSDSNQLTVNGNYLSGAVQDANKFYYTKGGIIFPTTTKSGQKLETNLEGNGLISGNAYVKLNIGSGLKFTEGYETTSLNTNTALGHSGCYTVAVDGKTISFDGSKQIQVKYDTDAITFNSNKGLSLNIPKIPDLTGLTSLPLSTVALLKVDGPNGIVIDVNALKQVINLILAVK